jgi:hypothetical protein
MGFRQFRSALRELVPGGELSEFSLGAPPPFIFVRTAAVGRQCSLAEIRTPDGWWRTTGS